MKTVNYKLLEIKFKTFGTRKYGRNNEKFHVGMYIVQLCKFFDSFRD